MSILTKLVINGSKSVNIDKTGKNGFLHSVKLLGWLGARVSFDGSPLCPFKTVPCPMFDKPLKTVKTVNNHNCSATKLSKLSKTAISRKVIFMKLRGCHFDTF